MELAARKSEQELISSAQKLFGRYSQQRFAQRMLCRGGRRRQDLRAKHSLAAMILWFFLVRRFPAGLLRFAELFHAVRQGESLFSMIQVEVAILMELLALFDTLSILAVGRVKLVMQMDILFGFSAADKICIFLQHMILVVTHVSDRQNQTQP